MIKTFWIAMLSLVSSMAFGETIGKVEVDFPLSHNDWVVLFDQYDIDEFDGEESDIKVLTHREGDALEVFFVFASKDGEGWEDDEDEPDTKESVENEINEWICEFFPNHRFHLTTFIDEKDHGFMEWVFHDGNMDLMHGITRALEIGDRSYTFGYFTTAEKSEETLSLWNNVINQVRILE